MFRRRREEKLFKAVDEDDDTTARELLSHGGLDWKNPEWHFSTPMHMCARSDAYKCLKLLLQQKADVDLRDGDGKTVTEIANLESSQKVFDLLQKRRLSFPIENEAFDFTLNGRLGFLKKLYNKEIPPRLNSQHTTMKITPLHIAAERNKIQCLLYLIEIKSSVNFEDKFGNTPLHTAIKHGNNEVVAHLLASKASHKVTNKWKNTPLHTAAEHNNVEAARQLLRVRALLSQKNLDGLIPIRQAKKFNSKSVFQLIANKESREAEEKKLFEVCKVKSNVKSKAV